MLCVQLCGICLFCLRVRECKQVDSFEIKWLCFDAPVYTWGSGTLVSGMACTRRKERKKHRMCKCACVRMCVLYVSVWNMYYYSFDFVCANVSSFREWFRHSHNLNGHACCDC